MRSLRRPATVDRLDSEAAAVAVPGTSALPQGAECPPVSPTPFYFVTLEAVGRLKCPQLISFFSFATDVRKLMQESHPPAHLRHSAQGAELNAIYSGSQPVIPALQALLQRGAASDV